MRIPSVFRVLSGAWVSWSHHSHSPQVPAVSSTFPWYHVLKEWHDIKKRLLSAGWYGIKDVCHLLHIKFKMMQRRVSTAAQRQSQRSRLCPSSYFAALSTFWVCFSALPHGHTVLPQPHASCPRSRDLCQKKTKKEQGKQGRVFLITTVLGFFTHFTRDLGGAILVHPHQITWPPLLAKEAGKRPICTDTTGLHPLPKLKIGGSINKDRALWWSCRHQG